MTDLLQKYENAQIARLTAGKELPDFRAGDVVRVRVKITDGAADSESVRIQAFEGLCIAIKNRGMASAITVRKISHGEGVERIFPLYSPRIEGIDIVRRGVIRRAKLYYMRDLTGKAARIKEKRETISNDNGAGDAQALEQSNAKKAAKAEKKAAKAERKAAPKEAKKERKPKKKVEKN